MLRDVYSWFKNFHLAGHTRTSVLRMESLSAFEHDARCSLSRTCRLLFDVVLFGVFYARGLEVVAVAVGDLIYVLIICFSF